MAAKKTRKRRGKMAAPIVRRTTPQAYTVGALRRDLERVIEQGGDLSPAEMRGVISRFKQAVDILPPEDDLPLEPSEGGGAPVFGRAASPTEQMFSAGGFADQDPVERGRQNALVDYEDMVAQFPEVRRALAMIGEGATSSDHGTDAYKLVFAPGVEESVRTLIQDADERLNLQHEIRSVCISSTKLGDVFGELVTDDAGQIVEILARPARSMIRVEDGAGRLVEYQQKFRDQRDPIVFAPGQIVHLRAEHEWGCKYGTSAFASARFVYRKYAMMDDAMVVHRLTRAVPRLNFEVDVSGMTEKQADAFIAKQMDRVRRESIVTSSGKLDLSTRAMGDLQDIFTAKRNQGMGGVTSIEGSRNVANIADVLFMYRRLLTSLPVPPSFMGIEADVNARATVSEEAINYARYLRAKQSRELAPFVARIHRRQAALAGRVLGRNDLEVRFGPVSVLDALMRANIMKVKAEAAKILGVDLGYPAEFIVRSVLDVPPDEVDDVLDMIEQAEDDEVLPPPTAPPPFPPGPEAQREGRRVRRALLSDATLRDVVVTLRDSLRFMAEERRRWSRPGVDPTPVDG